MATVLHAVIQRLAAIVPPALPPGVNYYRDRADPISREETPAVNQLPADDEVHSFADDADLHFARVDFSIAVRQEGGTLACETIHQALHNALSTDPELAVLCESVRLEGGPFDHGEADETAIHKRVRYRFTYLIPPANL